MAETEKNVSTPIQRNAYDVAMELMKLDYYYVGTPTTSEEIEATFTKYFALAKVLGSVRAASLEKFISEDITSKME